MREAGNVLSGGPLAEFASYIAPRNGKDSQQSRLAVFDAKGIANASCNDTEIGTDVLLVERGIK